MTGLASQTYESELEVSKPSQGSESEVEVRIKDWGMDQEQGRKASSETPESGAGREAGTRDKSGKHGSGVRQKGRVQCSNYPVAQITFLSPSGLNSTARPIGGAGHSSNQDFDCQCLCWG